MSGAPLRARGARLESVKKVLTPLSARVAAMDGGDELHRSLIHGADQVGFRSGSVFNQARGVVGS